MKQELALFIKKIIDLPAAEEKKLLAITRVYKVPKGDFYIQIGQIPKKFAFVAKGLFRYVYIDSKGNEFTKNFVPENNFALAYSSMIRHEVSKMAIEALEDSIICEIDYTDWLTLKKGNACWNIFLITILENAFTIKENRERDLLLLDAEQRYETFRQEFPALETRVKQHLIASYLGISPVSLSRIRKKRT
ncbi:Crp/Fnr family transcriptional regulator [Cytophaga hutchinsonii]|jgi:CRP-like cAMP-binding protein|uniref:Cyclic nucleotide binding regulatory protein n=1 Tax=Cytophaga hutchinsonii (strain ATCC 33406 / DSM 1761 / CIP 103989 / NBRC 15051 / NCIMB 9469 / D465) TaxID=269798 RepID=A0A6N4ST16_CYTH3|nr:Crp/Fnr family transcriptional regulator [Cytophaga hutchinsonii]ABG59520.1 cyclic nucleotide binding regulatory protein [Cytophaga hutchinsonii ATCC 33406]SFX94710.1 cAMP-binding domain of CRP or a regulatory subunit of cAMP-dependent protein kinases [Cytophaga hutchinsonii ATCC 33406]